ncbi:hypothetical protein FB451DRAFT_727234 [Mycena latifolia]|nr:hypothetical protein FB451DRAFT_727234 [Mycena latifolia]
MPINSRYPQSRCITLLVLGLGASEADICDIGTPTVTLKSTRFSGFPEKINSMMTGIDCRNLPSSYKRIFPLRGRLGARICLYLPPAISDVGLVARVLY